MSYYFSSQNRYNIYQDCYDSTYNLPRKLTNYHHYYDSTDNQFGYPCWNIQAIDKYLNRLDVQQAIHIDSQWQNSVRNWKMCNSKSICILK